MHRTTIMLDDALIHRARQRAEAEGISLGELIRRSLARFLEEPRGLDPFFADDAVYEDSGPADMAAEHDRYLYGEGA
ncbi:ribbon-helix-helix domain-containing protein [Deferrisoma camini]|uniref:ribbon-helix-helix domain-containing protein n=1 Tax=Deferrisoma camini TaxID=1035120 RepID=UPI00046D75D9|nr:ribbon-helix-helix domain-containing protein [Deferrisoma camini]